MVADTTNDLQPGRRRVLLLDRASVPAHHHHGLCRRARRLHARQSRHRSAGARKLPPGRAPRAGRHGRSLAGETSSAGAPGGHQAHSTVGLNGRERPDDAIRRFEHEAQVTAGLSSPHTVQLFDFGVADDGSFYYVMELLDGLDFERLVQQHGPVPAERAIYFLRQVCHSLAEAESHGLVHRDIKPANLFACRYGGEYDFVKVLDFGIAKAAPDMMETGSIDLTRDNILQGTPAYIAPEQVLGGTARGQSCGHLRHGMRRLLPAHRKAGLHRRDAHGRRRASRPHAADAAVGELGAADPACARPTDPGLPREESRRSPAVSAGAVAKTGGDRRPERHGRTSAPANGGRRISLRRTA